MVRRERVLELDGLVSVGACSNGNFSCQDSASLKRNEPTILANHWLDNHLARKLATAIPSGYAAAFAVRRESIPSSAFHSMHAAFSAASRAASAASGWEAMRFSNCLRQTFEW